MKRRLLSFVLVLACLLSLCTFGSTGVAEVQATEGIPDIMLYEDYPSSKEFQISTCYGLQKFSQLGQSNNFSGITFYIVADIDMSGISYTPVPAFSGTLDGGYHVIERLSVSTTNVNCGLFGTVNAAGTVRRLGLEGCTFSITSNSADYRVGSFAGVVKGLVDECWSSSVLTATASGSTTDLSVGGIAGALINGGIVKNSYFAGRATGPAHVSGIADWCQGQYEGYVGQIINCYNIGALSATTCYALGRYSGSILAANKTNAILNSYYFDSHTTYDWATGAKKVSKSYLGSGYLATLLNNGSTVWSKGAMFPELRGKGGVYSLKVTYDNKGYSSTATMYYNAGDTYTVTVPSGTTVNLTAGAGTVNGNVFTMPAQNTTLTVKVDLPNIAQFTTYPDASAYVITNTAGFTAMATAVNGGKTLSGKTIYMLGDIDMNSASHTPIGQFVSDSSWTKSFSGTFYGNNFKVFNLKVNNTSLNGGGLFGSCYKATFNGLHIFNGSVTCSNRAGGITGYADGGCKFYYCSNGADIKTTTGKDGAGGLAGVARSTCIFEYCANYGTVTATANAAAGIAGWGQTNIKLTGCINTGIITAPDDYAALARVGSGFSGTWTQCYYLKSACSTSASGSSKDESNFCTGIIGGSINTDSRTVANKGAFTNTPRFPAVCGENDAPATCTRLSAYDNGTYIGYVTVYANVGDEVAVTNSQDYYGSNAFTVTAALTSKSYPTAIPYTITYNLNGGTLTASAATSYSYVKGAALPLGTQISKDGYVFAGWYEASALTGQVSATVGPNVRGDKTYYAKWSQLVEIDTVEEYLAFVKAVNVGDNYSGKFVRITADLDFGGQTVSAVGTASAPFCGVLDGNGHTLSNFAISGDNAQGLVGYLKQGTVQFLKLENCTVSGKVNVGTVVGYNDSGLILGCESSGAVVNTGTIYDLSYMSFNIRCGEDPSPNTVSERTPRVKTYLANYQPDIIGLQEVTPTWKTVLSSALSGYSSEFKYRDSAGKEAAPLYWKSSKFTALEQGTFWLSETPDKMSYGWGATYYRTCSYAVLQPKNTNVIILAYNTHLDHQATLAQIEGIKLVKSRMDTMEKKYRDKGYTEIYSFVTGDFNAKPTAEAGKYLSNTMVEARNAAVSLGTDLNQNTFSAYNASPTSIIDYMFVSRNVDVKTYKVTLDKVNGNAISDHYGLYGTMRIGGNSQGGIVGMNKGHVQSCGFAGSIDSKAGCSGVAGFNSGKIVGSYGTFTPNNTEVFSNGIAPKVEGSVTFSYYPGSVGLSGSGSTTADMKNSAYLSNLNHPLKLWTMSASVNNGLPFICLSHEFIYTDNGNGTHKAACSYCGTAITENHSDVTDAAIAPSCTAEGKTEGSHCGICNAVITPQEAVPATGHSYEEETALTASCTETGLKLYTCTGCNHSYTEVIPAVGHTVVIDPGVPATCLSSGLSEGSHCETCNAVLVAQTTLPRLGHDFIPSDNGDGTHTESCSRCDKTVTSKHSFTDSVCICGAKESVQESTWKIGHTLNLASDISVNLAVSKSLLVGFDMATVYVLVEIDTYEGNTKTGTKTVKVLPEEQGDYYYFTLTGMNAVQMNDRIRSVLYGTKNGQVYYSATDDYSIADYAYSQMKKANIPASLKILCADLLRYGAKAQLFKGYRTDSLADALMTEEQTVFLSNIDAVTFGNTNVVLNDLSNATVTWSGKALDLASKVSLKFIFTPAIYQGKVEDLSLRLTFTGIDGSTKIMTLTSPEVYNADRGLYAFTFDGLLAAELRAVVSAQIYAGNTPVSATLQYSADTYGNNKTGALGDLCKALFAYSDSAKTFFAG